MISVRVTQEEFERLRHFCRKTGDRSVSELARSALSQMMNGRRVRGKRTLESRLAAVEKEIQRLSAMFKPAEPTESQSRG